MTDQEAHELAFKNRALTLAVLRRMRGSYARQDEEDAWQEAYPALFRAAKAHDPRKGKFSTLAFCAVFRQLKNWTDQNRLVRIPTGIFNPSYGSGYTKYREQSREYARRAQQPAKHLPRHIGGYAQEYDDTPEYVEEALRGLTPRERLVIVRCVMGGEPAKVLAKRFRVTKQRVHQIKVEALAKLRERMREADLVDIIGVSA